MFLDSEHESQLPQPVEAVFFDVGETILDETKEYGDWADWLGVPRHTFSAVFGGVIAQGHDYRHVFQVFHPGFDLVQARTERASAGVPESYGEADLYPDARRCLEDLREQGIFVGLAANQTLRSEGILKSLRLSVDVIGTSEGWGVEKPSRAFFDRLIAEADKPARRILYVGDRLDNDISPALEAGLQAAVVRRGPWALLLANDEAWRRCLFLLDSLAELPDRIERHNEALQPARI